MKLLIVLSLSALSSSRLLPANTRLSDRSLGGDDEASKFDAAKELEAVKVAAEAIFKNWGWSAELQDGKKLVLSGPVSSQKTPSSESGKEKPAEEGGEAKPEEGGEEAKSEGREEAASVAMVDVSFVLVQKDPSKPIKHFIELRNKATDSQDKRFDRLKTAHLIFRREYNAVLKSEVALYLSQVLQRFKSMSDRYAIQSGNSVVISMFDQVTKSLFANEIEVKVVAKTNYCYIADLIPKADPLRAVRLTLLTLSNGYYRMEMQENDRLVVSYGHSYFLPQLQASFAALLPTFTRGAVRDHATLAELSKSAKEIAVSMCGGTAFKIDDLKTDLGYVAFKIVPPANIKCPLSQTVFVATKMSDHRVEIFDIMFDGPHIQIEYAHPIKFAQLAQILRSKMTEYTRTEEIVKSGLDRSRAERSIDDAAIEKSLGQFLGGKLEEFELSGDQKTQMESETTKLFRSWKVSEKDVEVVVLKSDVGYLIDLFSPSRKASTRIEVQTLNGYDQLLALQAEISAFLSG